MPPKIIKLRSGLKVTVKSILLPNGNLLIPKRLPEDRNQAEWVEVTPGTSDHKRWLPVSIAEPDPREHSDYKKWKAEIDATLRKKG